MWGLIYLSSILREQCVVRGCKEKSVTLNLAVDSCVFLRQLLTFSVPQLLLWTLVSNNSCEFASSLLGCCLGEWWNRCRVLVSTVALLIYLFITCDTLRFLAPEKTGEYWSHDQDRGVEEQVFWRVVKRDNSHTYYSPHFSKKR